MKMSLSRKWLDGEQGGLRTQGLDRSIQISELLPPSLPLEPLDATVGPGSGQSSPPAFQPLPAAKMVDGKKKKILIGENHIPLVPGRPGLPGSPDVIKHKSVRMTKAQQF